MGGRPPASPSPQAIRLEILKELQQLIDNRDSRDRIDKGPVAETKGREHWVFHLLLRAEEINQAHTDTLIGSAYSNLTARLQTLEDRLVQLSELSTGIETDLKSRLESLESGLSATVDQGLTAGTDKIASAVGEKFRATLDEKWKPVSESIETFAQGSKQILKDVADTYRVSTQTRLLLNENARRIADLGRDIVALEESLKLVLQKTVEEAIQPLEARVAALETHLGVSATNSTVPSAEPPSEKAP